MAERWITPPADIPILHPDTEEPSLDADGKPIVATFAKIMLAVLAHPKLTGSAPALKSNNLIKRMQQALAMSMERKQFLEGDVLFRRGQDASRLYQLITGEVELIRSDASPVRVAPEHLLQGFLEPTPYLRCAPQDCTATALSPLMVIAIDQASRIAVVRNYPELVLKMLESV